MIVFKKVKYKNFLSTGQQFIEIQLDRSSKTLVVGENGAGKSTFLKLLEGDILPTQGWVNRHTKLRLARFSQHHLESMNLEEDCVAHMKSLDSEMPLEEARAYLGRFGLSGELATKPVKSLESEARARGARRKAQGRRDVGTGNNSHNRQAYIHRLSQGGSNSGFFPGFFGAATSKNKGIWPQGRHQLLPHIFLWPHARGEPRKRLLHQFPSRFRNRDFPP